MGEAEVLPTPSGCILKGLLESGVRIGISSRGVGNGVPNSDGVLVIESYKLITFDAVADPSTINAYQKEIGSSGPIVRAENTYSTVGKMQESTINNKVNANALISYLGYITENRRAKIIQERFNHEEK